MELAIRRHLIVLTVFLFACTRPSGTAGDSAGGLAVDDVSVAPTENVATVLRVRWSTPEPSTSWVEYGPDTDYGARTPPDLPSTVHETLLFGMPADAEVHLRIIAEADDEQVATDDIEAWTDPQLPAVPQVTASGSGQDGFTVTTLMGSVWAPALLDSRGRVVWFWPVAENDDHVFRTRLARGGQALLCAIPGSERIVRVAFDGTVIETIVAESLSHDFVETDDGGLAWITFDTRDMGGRQVTGDAIVERAADGRLRTVWSAWDHLDPGGFEETDWTHANILDFDAERQVYRLSLRNLSTIYEIDRRSGTVLRSIGENGTMPVADGSTAFQNQHEFQYLPDGNLLVFDNGLVEKSESKAREYRLDGDSGTAVEVWSYGRPDPLFVYAMGGAHRYQNGDTLVAWTTAGLLERVDPSGLPTWQVQGGLGIGIGFSGPAQLATVEWP